LPSVAEAVTTFDDQAASFFGANLAGAADIAESEAHRRYQAGLDRSALLAVSLILAIREQTAAEYSPRTAVLEEMKTALLARLGNNGKPSDATPKFASR
jgi:hypothetical protein